MYRIKHPRTGHIIIFRYPLLQKCIGLGFVIIGFIVAYFVFPQLIILRCTRSENLCLIEQSNIFRTIKRTIPLEDVVRAKLEEMHSRGRNGKSQYTYRIWIITRQDSLSFTPFGIGTLREGKEEVVSEINAFLKKPYLNSLEVAEDERLYFYSLSAGLIIFGLLPLCFVRNVKCILDKTENRFFIVGNTLWGFKKTLCALSELVDIKIVTHKEGYRIVFIFTSGETIPLTYYGYHDIKRQQQILEELKDCIVQG